jgi:nicotinate-nucleotide pyrophosphorylase (carboxylating)
VTDRGAPSDLILGPLLRAALAEDLGSAGDVTSQACIPPDARFAGKFVARAPGVLAGIDCARLTFALLDPEARFAPEAADGAAIGPGETVATISGAARAILAGERVALNLLSRLSGIATLTAAYVEAVRGTGARIVDTRKTTPGLRALEKYAVRCGGGGSHRYGLGDAILIKDNHVAACGGVTQALRRTRERAGHMLKIEVEVDGLEQLREALAGGPDIILLDNFSIADLAAAVELAAGRAKLEASGGVSLATVRAIAATGVDYISVGALTHSAPALDIGLDAG